MKLDGSGRVVLDDTPTPADTEPDDLWAAAQRGLARRGTDTPDGPLSRERGNETGEKGIA